MKKSDFQKIKTLGRGGFGEATLVRDKEKKVYVLKRISIDTKKSLKLAVSEAQLLRTLKHPNIIRYIDHFIE
ncbi:MAG: serine/threonine protein kinase, partial [Candidatus Thermoplasmatota archaeon]|nr:serine/threonine protein kinase [Candidatus Thermoplasmatota archaeon]